ncbi:MAG: ATP-dependent RecD-like DNA helicase [Clostridiales bacterium]|nr:ATP-dependent RecD-like DNA helicase [Clostridiales bacterium]
MEHLRCVVERITYQNTENGYTVLKVAVKNYHELVTVVGIMPDTHVGSVLSLEGFWKVDAKYGRQFSVEKYEETLPATVYGIEKYLGSGLIKGVGPKFARRIVEKFGKDTLDIIEEEPDRLLEVAGIGAVRVARIRKSWEEQKEIKNIMLFLQSHGVSTAHATKIFKTYGSDSIQVVEENPYRLADDIWGIGFKTADTIAEKLGIGKERFIRLRSGLFYTLNKLSESGHCYAVREQLIEAAEKLLEVEAPQLEMTLDEMLRTEEVIRDEEAIYLPAFYFSEAGCARRLGTLMDAERKMKMDPDKVMDRVLKQSEISYDKIQQEAIYAAISSKVMILTGGPGTGKTTTTMGIISAYQIAGYQVILAAPTGRAAKRMSEATGMEAKTIHRLLEYKPPEGYQKNEEAPLEGDVLILDECSMIDIMLMYHVLKAMPDHMTLIMVGDTDQLPSVGAGNVLKDMIASGKIPVARLTRIFRQAQGSRIIMNAHRINQGENIDMRGGKDSDFFFAAKETNEEVVETLVQYCTKNLPRYYHVDALQDIQVLTPMQRGICGAANLNQLLQEAMNPSDIFLRRGGTQYRLNDKVMQIRNNYDKEVFNGDIGKIIRVDMEERELTVDYDGRSVVYDVSELDELVLAYATTIHKSQGSEYPIVVMPFTMSHFVMLQRNLLYTGVTRAKKILVLIGEKRAVYYAIQNETTTARNTKLAQRLIQNIADAANSMPTKTGDSAIFQQGNVVSFQKETIEKSKNEEKVINWKGGIRIPLVREEPSFYRGDLFQRLSQSSFRSSFSLRANDRAYVREKGMDTVRSHAHEFIEKRLAPAEPVKDGKQTPMRGHPAFVAQHATGTCCRGCLEKWHGIPKGRPLTESEKNYVVDVIMEWICRQMQTNMGK